MIKQSIIILSLVFSGVLLAKDVSDSYELPSLVQPSKELGQEHFQGENLDSELGFKVSEKEKQSRSYASDDNEDGAKKNLKSWKYKKKPKTSKD